MKLLCVILLSLSAACSYGCDGCGDSHCHGGCGVVISIHVGGWGCGNCSEKDEFAWQASPVIKDNGPTVTGKANSHRLYGAWELVRKDINTLWYDKGDKKFVKEGTRYNVTIYWRGKYYTREMAVGGQTISFIRIDEPANVKEDEPKFKQVGDQVINVDKGVLDQDKKSVLNKMSLAMGLVSEFSEREDAKVYRSSLPKFIDIYSNSATMRTAVNDSVRSETWLATNSYTNYSRGIISFGRRDNSDDIYGEVGKWVFIDPSWQWGNKKNDTKVMAIVDKFIVYCKNHESKK